MNLTSLLLLSFFVLTLKTFAQDSLPKVTRGTLERIEQFQSQYVTPRNIDIWLPEGYSDSTKYAVLYMHDGQMLYDPAQTWNKQAWDVDDVATELVQTTNIKPFIIVGIWNGGTTRHIDYFPQQPLERLSQVEKDTITAQLTRAGRTTETFSPQSDNYLKFIVNELKPLIDQRYSVHTDRENTCIMGSSMGGLISLYAICEYPKIFGAAACLSTHWTGSFTLENNPMPDAFLRYLKKALPHPNKHKIYFDCGDQTLDALYPAIQKKVDALMKRKGYDEKSWQTEYFPGENHSEQAWKKRLDVPLGFLFGE